MDVGTPQREIYVEPLVLPEPLGRLKNRNMSLFANLNVSQRTSRACLIVNR